MTVNAALPASGGRASSAFRRLAHRVYRAAQESHPEGRCLGRHRDTRPCEVLYAAVLGACGRRGCGLRFRARRLTGGGSVSSGSRDGGLRLITGSRLLAPPRAAESGARAGEVSEHAPLVVGVLAVPLGVGLGLVAAGHSAPIPSRPTDACAAGPLRNSGAPSVFLDRNSASEPASACARAVRRAGFPLRMAEHLYFKKYSGYHRDRRLTALRPGMDSSVRAARTGADPRFVRNIGFRGDSAGRTRLPE